MSFLRWASMVPYGIQMMTHHHDHQRSDDASPEGPEPVEPEPVIRLDFTWSRVVIISMISAFLGAAGAREFTMALQNQAQDLAIQRQGQQIDRNTKIIDEKLLTKEEFQVFVTANGEALRIIDEELRQHDARGKR